MLNMKLMIESYILAGYQASFMVNRASTLADVDSEKSNPCLMIQLVQPVDTSPRRLRSGHRQAARLETCLEAGKQPQETLQNNREKPRADQEIPRFRVLTSRKCPNLRGSR